VVAILLLDWIGTVVVYEKADNPIGSINVYQAFENKWDTNPSIWSFDLDKLADNSCSRSAQVTQISHEGDSYKGDDLWINGQYMGDNTYNGSTAPNLDIDTYNIVIDANQQSIEYKTRVFNVNSQFGLAREFTINTGFVVKTNACSTLKPN